MKSRWYGFNAPLAAASLAGVSFALAFTLARTLLMASLNSSAAFRQSRAPEIPREMGSRRPYPSPVTAAWQQASRSPPCAPTPGASIQASGFTLRTALIASVSVAPTTSPTLLCLFHSWPGTVSEAILSKTQRWSPTTLSVCICEEDGFEVLQSTKAPFVAPYLVAGSTNGARESQPMYGESVIASASTSSNADAAYASEVVPISPRLASSRTSAPVALAALTTRFNAAAPSSPNTSKKAAFGL
mmetsp:Transcript_81541/g.243071  ORF Transcript_81541/g.243071 Transcript_81541/m.243071 type:complete len:244 (+) Transcript_81541:880-1611(+)